MPSDTKAGKLDPKAPIGVRKWRNFTTLPMGVLAEVGAAFLEGHLKGYRRHNYRVTGATASVYIDAALGHIIQWWEGEELDPLVKLNHLVKAIACLMIVRDSQMQGLLDDDRPPKANLDELRDHLQEAVDHMFSQWPDPVEPFTELNKEISK